MLEIPRPIYEITLTYVASHLTDIKTFLERLLSEHYQKFKMRIDAKQILPLQIIKMSKI